MLSEHLPVNPYLNSIRNSLTDGLLIFRFLLHVTGAADFSGTKLIAGVLRNDCVRCDRDEIFAALDNAFSIGTLNINDDSITDLQNDGILILRQIFGFRGDALFHDIDLSASRKDRTEIETYLQSLSQ